MKGKRPRDADFRRMTELLTSGYKMLRFHCPECMFPLFQSPDGTIICPGCGAVFEEDEEGIKMVEPPTEAVETREVREEPGEEREEHEEPEGTEETETGDEASGIEDLETALIRFVLKRLERAEDADHEEAARELELVERAVRALAELRRS